MMSMTTGIIHRSMFGKKDGLSEYLREGERKIGRTLKYILRDTTSNYFIQLELSFVTQ